MMPIIVIGSVYIFSCGRIVWNIVRWPSPRNNLVSSYQNFQECTYNTVKYWPGAVIQRYLRPTTLFKNSGTGVFNTLFIEHLWWLLLTGIISVIFIGPKNHQFRASSSRGVDIKVFERGLNIDYHGWPKQWDFGWAKMVKFGFFFLIYSTHIKLPKLKLIFPSHNTDLKLIFPSHNFADLHILISQDV